MSRSAGPPPSPLSASCQPTSSMTVFSQPSSFPHSLDERTPFPFRWCLVIRHLRHYGRERRACLATDSPRRSFSFASGSLIPRWEAAGVQAGRRPPRRGRRALTPGVPSAPCPGWKQRPRTGRSPRPKPAPKQHPTPSAAASLTPLLSAPPGPLGPQPSHPRDRQGSLK